MKKLTIPADVQNLERVQSFIDAELEDSGCPMKTQMQIDIAVEELFVNICHYAYAPGTGDAEIGVRVEGEPARVEITFSDSGVPYNPLEKDDPDVNHGAEDRQIGGHGIFMAKTIMDDMQYEYRDGRNCLCISKALG